MTELTTMMTMMTRPAPPIGKCGKNKHAGASGAEEKSDLDKAAILEAFKTSTGFASFYKAAPLTPS
jgi:hypothetical protein